MKRSTKGSIEIDSSSCPICESALKAEIERLDSIGKEEKTIKWARQKGLNISKFSLIKHRVNHREGAISGNNGDSGEKNDQASETQSGGADETPAAQADQLESHPKRKSAVKRKSAQRSEAEGPEKSQIPAKSVTAIDADPITDQLLLDAVRDRVYQKLINNEIELNLGDGFKAIEIKHKISEQSQNEKLLLEILNEIRAEELKKD